MKQNLKSIIIGGGIAGKLAARVLSASFQSVIILEQDSEVTSPNPRKGAPQGNHIHALLHAGEHGLEQLFPGITEHFYSTGAIKINSTKDLAWHHHGVWKLRYDGGYTTTLQTRPHLEWHINQYIKKDENITIRYNQTVKKYVFDKGENRIIGVELKNGSIIYADLIIDASGASSFSYRWLTEQGVQVPEEKVKIGLTYVSQIVELPDNNDRDWTIKLLYPDPPHEKMAGSLSKVEGNRYLATFIGYHNIINDKDTLKENSLLALAEKLPKTDIFHELQNAQPLTGISIYKVPHITWRKIEKVKKFPSGLLMIGDTLCRIDPFFGQGMSIAVLEALALKDILQNQSQDNIAQKFHKKAAKIIAPIWNMVLTEDFRYSETTGKKPLGFPILQWYARNVFLLSAKDKNIYDSFIKVMNLKRPMTILMQPLIVFAVLKKGLTKKRRL
ncbi:NAD(P)/FAD-dependent oxidoreductase [Bacillus sp. REN16]|uniref:NAD(P)/FAD-dependent oxidoreductase n=1 Tax=Bacillus sp. REN16 TaxID=2887296 RepID=UPI001E39760A|nr:FAD-dependent monooxygenase [Bacillus sp. REN16]MCC3357186.1 FAD-dependent monooxygenase [Bacillus sp. REN16]